MSEAICLRLALILQEEILLILQILFPVSKGLSSVVNGTSFAMWNMCTYNYVPSPSWRQIICSWFGFTGSPHINLSYLVFRRVLFLSLEVCGDFCVWGLCALCVCKYTVRMCVCVCARTCYTCVFECLFLPTPVLILASILFPLLWYTIPPIRPLTAL